MRRAAAIALALALLATACDTRLPLPRPPSGPGRSASAEIDSEALGRTMPYQIYFPPGYDASTTQRYPTLYLLHGLGAHDDQWDLLGLPAVADRLIHAGAIAPLIVVMPEGEDSYWVDHADDGEHWGAYVAEDLVEHVDSTYRTITGPSHRAIGGISMGAHGAVQLSLNYPGVFSIVGAHSLVLRPPNTAPATFGSGEAYAARDPMALVRTKTKVAQATAYWIDIGIADEWAPLAEQFDRELSALRIAHQFREWPGGHTNEYWSAHLEDYLRYYDTELSRRAGIRIF